MRLRRVESIKFFWVITVDLISTRDSFSIDRIRLIFLTVSLQLKLLLSLKVISPEAEDFTYCDHGKL